MTRNGSSYDKVSMRQITFCSLPLNAINEDDVLWLKHKVNLPRNTGYWPMYLLTTHYFNL